MSSFETMKKEAQKLHLQIDEFLKIDREELYGEKRLHELSFHHHGEEQFEATFNLIEKLSKCHFERVPLQKINSIKRKLEEYKSIFERAKNLNLKSDNSPKNTRNSIVQNLENYYDSFFNDVSSVISLTYQKEKIDFKQIEDESKQALEQVKAHSEEHKKQMENQKKSSEAILESMRKASAEAGVSQEAIHYSEAQKNHSKMAEQWYSTLRWLLISLIIFVIITGCFLILKHKSNAIPTLGYLEITILIVISLWIYAINFCNKNYYAEKHNEIINANKARTLTSFSSFVEASKDENIKNQVLLHASASAFSNPPTGFGKNQSVPLPPILELTKKVISGSSNGN